MTNYVSVGGASAAPVAASLSKATTDIRSTFASTETLKAELLWTLQTVAKDQSYHSNDDIAPLFTLMFPDSATAQGFSCGENKTAYLAKYGLGQFIKQKLVAQFVFFNPWTLNKHFETLLMLVCLTSGIHTIQRQHIRQSIIRHIGNQSLIALHNLSRYLT